MKKSLRDEGGFTALEALLSAFIMTGIIAGAFLVFGALSEKSDLLLGDTELRQRIRNTEELLRRDLERAVPSAELEWYAERDGVPGPRFNPEPFADYGSDGTPDSAELGYDGDPVVVGAACTSATYNPDPRCDNAPGFIFPHNTVCGAGSPTGFCGLTAGFGGVWTPGVFGSFEGNGRLDPGEWLIDIDANGHYTGEPFFDYFDAPPTPTSSYDQNGNLLAGASLNFNFDLTPSLFPNTGATWNFPRQVDFVDVDGDGVFSPMDEYWSGGLALRGDPTPEEDNPLTFLVDETFSAIDGMTGIVSGSAGYPGSPALAFDFIARNLKPLTPFGFIDFPFSTALYPVPTRSTNNRFDAFEIPVYDYFGGVVNRGDQDSLYLRTFVEVGGQEVPANVFYRIVFQNANRNYSEASTDAGINGFPDPNFIFVDPTTPIPPNVLFGAGDGIWQAGEAFTDTNGNGVRDPIVDPGERRLQRIVLLPGAAPPVVQDLGPAVRFNVEYFDAAKGRFVAPFSDTGVDGLFDGEEPNFNNPPAGPVSCPDPNGDNFFPGLLDLAWNQTVNPAAFNDDSAATEGNGLLDLVNTSGVPAVTLNRNPFLVGYPFASGAPPSHPISSTLHAPGENPFEGFKRFGYPDSAGSVVFADNFAIYPLNAREQLPVMGHLDWVALEPLSREQNARYTLLKQLILNYCSPNSALSSGGGPTGICSIASCNLTNVSGFVRYLFSLSDILDGRLYRFSPAAVFDDEGWLRCAGVRDSFAFLKPGDQVFVWGFWIPPEVSSSSPGSEAVRVPVPPGYYSLIQKRGNRLLLDLSKVPGGAPTLEQLRGVPAVFRAPYLPPALRIDFALEGFGASSRTGQGIYHRDLRVWSLLGQGFDVAGLASQGTPPSIPIRGTVFTVQPGQGSGTGSRRPNGLPY